MAKKAEIVSQFQRRLTELIERRGTSLSAFAQHCGLDRSALSQFLEQDATRLPRAETLYGIAAAESVSVDWLLGLSQSDETVGQVEPAVSIEIASGGRGETRLAGWHREALGYKIRYVPTSLPDLLCTKATVEYELSAEEPQFIEAKETQVQVQLDYSRTPETDIEAVMPYQTLYNLAAGVGMWSGLTRGARQAQLEHMARLLDELYPTFRLFLHDGLKAYSAPFTVFGPKRAVVYLGGMYLVINSVEQIRDLTTRFDHLIRVASISPDRAAGFVGQLKVT